MATVDNRIVQLEFKNAEFTKAMAATLEAIKALNEALKTVGGDNSFADITDDADTMSSRVGSAVKTAVAALPGMAAKAGDVAGRMGEAGSKMASSLLPIGKSAEEATKKLQGISTGADFNKITDAASRVSLAPIGASVDKISLKFLAFSTVAVTALSRITDKAIDTASQLAKGFTTDQVTAGFQEYELKLGSIQTIMAGTGESLETVNGKLDDLNGYADRTIYSFADMTQNIGKFTNAGVDLDTSVASIQGVAQVAALSGANTQEASRAMYNFAQALSKGHVQLIDWKSIELANMGTVEFKQQLIDAAEATGSLTKEGDKWVTSAGKSVSATEGFNDSLTDQWLTTEVLTGTLGKYADETTDIGKRAYAASSDIKTFTQLIDVVKESIGSGFASSFEILIGDFEQAKKLFGDVGKVIDDFVGGMTDSRNEMLQLFSDMGGRQTVIWALRDAFVAIGHILEPIGRAFREVFPKNTAQDWVALADKFRNLIGAMEPSAKTMTNLHRIFKGLFSAMKIGKTVIRALFDSFSDFLSRVGFGQGNILEFAAGIGDFFVELEKGLVSTGKLSELFDSIGLGASDAAGKIQKHLGNLPEFLSKVWQSIQDIWAKIRGWLSTIGEAFAEAIDPTAFTSAGEVVSVGLLSAIALGIGKLLKDGLDFGPSGVFDGITDALGELTGVLSAMQENLRAGALLKLAGALGVLALSLAILAAIDGDALARAGAGMTALMAQLVGVVAALKALSLGFSSVTIAVTAAGILLLSASVLVLAIALKKIGALDTDTIIKGLYGIASGLTILVIAVNELNAGGNLVKAGLSMILMAAAMIVMAEAMERIGALDMDAIGKGLFGIAGGLGVMVGAIRLIPEGRLISMAVALTVVAGAMYLLAKALQQFASMSLDEIAIGLYGMASALTVIGIALDLFPDNTVAMAGGLLLAAIAMNLVATAIRNFGSMSLEELAQGLGGMAGALLILSVALNGMSTTLAGAAALVLAAVAVRVFAGAMGLIADLSIGQLVTSLIALGVALFLLSVAGLSLAGVSPALIAAGIGLALIGASVALVGIGMAALAKAIQIIAEVGLTAVKVVIEAVGELVQLIPLIAQAIVDTLVVIVSGLPALLEPLKTLIIGILDLIIELIPKFAEVIITILDELIRILREKVPDFIELGWEILTAFLQGIEDNIEEITETVSNIITKFIDALTEKIPEFVESITNFLSTVMTEVAGAWGETMPTLLIDVADAFITGFIKGLEEALPKLWELITSIPEEILKLIKSLFGIKSPSTVMKALGLDVIIGFLNGIVEAAVGLFAWFAELAGEVIGYFVDAVTWLWDAGWDVLSGLLDGIVDGAKAVWNWFGDIAGTITDYFLDAIDWLWDFGIDLLTGLLDGIVDGAKAVWNWFTELPGEILGLIPNPLDILKGVGGLIMDGLTSGLKAGWNAGKNFLGGIGGAITSLKGPPEKDAVLLIPIGKLIFQGLFKGMSAGWKKNAEWLSQLNPADELDDDAIATAFRGIAAQMENSFEGMNMDPTITPVVDLTEVRRGLGLVQGLAPSVSLGTANAISTSLNASPDGELEGATAGGRGDLVFNQTINSPTELSATDIYRDTRNQITLAKEELEIP